MDLAVVGRFLPNRHSCGRFLANGLSCGRFLANGGSCNNRKERRSKAKVLNSALYFPSLLELGKPAAGCSRLII